MILSNVDRESFSATRALLEHGFKFNKVLTAQDIGSYKPDPANFEFMLDTLKKDFDIDREHILITAQSRLHDHKPANGLCLSSCWIDREGASMGHAEDAAYTFAFPTLGAFADAVEKEANE